MIEYRFGTFDKSSAVVRVFESRWYVGMSAEMICQRGKISSSAGIDLVFDIGRYDIWQFGRSATFFDYVTHIL